MRTSWWPPICSCFWSCRRCCSPLQHSAPLKHSCRCCQTLCSRRRSPGRDLTGRKLYSLTNIACSCDAFLTQANSGGETESSASRSRKAIQSRASVRRFPCTVAFSVEVVLSTVVAAVTQTRRTVLSLTTVAANLARASTVCR